MFAAGPWPGVPIIDLREPTEAELGAHMPHGWQTCDMELDLTCPNYNMNRDGTPEQIYSQLRRIARLRWLRCTYGNQVMRQDSSFTEYITLKLCHLHVALHIALHVALHVGQELVKLTE